MRARQAQIRDYPKLLEIAKKSGFPYPDLESPLIEDCWVVVNEKDVPIMAVAAERIVQLYLWCDEFEHPGAKLAAMRILQNSSMRGELKRRGYVDACVFLPPEIAKSFGSRLERSLKWLKEWPCWALRL
jgi:hypothetical protein